MANSNPAADFLTMLLAGAGASLSPGGAPVANMVVGQMATKNYGKMISDLLAGGGKLSADAENVSIKAPTNAFAGMLGTGNPSSYTPSNQGLPTLQQRMGGAGVQTPANVNVPGQRAGTATGGLAQLLPLLLGGGVNPTSSPLAGANLVGLTPEHINSAMKLKMMQDQLAGEDIRNRLDVIKTIQDLQPEQPFPIPVPGLGPVPVDVWRALPDDQKEYAAYVHQARSVGDTDIMSFKEFISEFEPHERIKFLEQLSERPELKALEEDLRSRSATKISISPYKRSFESRLGSTAGEILSPDRYATIRKRLEQENWRPDRDKIKLLEDEGYSYRGAKERLKQLKVLDEWDAEIKGIHPNAEFKGDGWYVDGKLIMRNPYQ